MAESSVAMRMRFAGIINMIGATYPLLDRLQLSTILQAALKMDASSGC
jgi:hypothetical protein